MADFFKIATKSTKRGSLDIYPKFVIKKSTDLMIRGGDFYAVWLEKESRWSTDEQDAINLIDDALDEYYEANKSRFDDSVHVLHLWDAETGMIDSWHKYCQRQMRDSFHMLDETLIFDGAGGKKVDYASKCLPYKLEEGTIDAWEHLVSVLYSPEERHKLEWAIGSIVSGDSKQLQKFVVLYGAAGTGKSTVLGVIEKLFQGYYSVFDAKSLGSANNSFALEPFKTNPLVAIQHDGDLSHIEDNTRLNSLVSHEMMTVNEKFKSTYANRFKCFLFIGTNKPVKITDAKSGLLRRLIDITPTGNKIPKAEYEAYTGRIDYELGAIAYHCLQVYKADKRYYDTYIPINMMGASNTFYNFVLDQYLTFSRDDMVSLKTAWEMYKAYCEESNVSYPMSKMIFKEELKNYFTTFDEKGITIDGERVRNIYSGFRADKFVREKKTVNKAGKLKMIFKEQESIFDAMCQDCPAQYATKDETPGKKWADVSTTLSKLDTHRLHYVKVPENHIVIDFDIPDENGNKSFERNMEAAALWPPTYAELSKSEQGIHLHYIYTGDVSQLSRVYADHIEIKVFSGKSSLRRKLTLCNDLPIATIGSGLPLKENKMVNFDAVKSEKGLRALVVRNLNKEIHPGTKPSIDFIKKILDDAYDSGLKYDISDMRPAVIDFAANSSHQADYCMRTVKEMKFKSEEPTEAVRNEEAPIIFFDIEVFPNLFLVNWKEIEHGISSFEEFKQRLAEGKTSKVVRMINPTALELEPLLKNRLVGFNNRRYDNHVVYARWGYSYDNAALYELSQKIITDKKNKYTFGEAYNLSYTDIYDYCAKKQSLKKWEIELGIHHQELGLPWDQPVPEEKWNQVAEYCDNDVISTEAVWWKTQEDFIAREILADVADATPNDTTNSLTTKIIFGKNRKPQDKFRWRDLSKPVTELPQDVKKFLKTHFPEMMAQRHGPANSLLPYFPEYSFDPFKGSFYKGVEVGEGGYVYSEPDEAKIIYTMVALLDIMSMHPHSDLAECLFGVEFTERFWELVYGRVFIKHEEWDEINDILDGKMTKWIDQVKSGKLSSKSLANALKIAINSVYGLTAASFENPFRDPKNIDNIVAKRGALFMVDLKEEVERRGFVVAHIKTDSIKIPDATPEIIEFVMEFGKLYGYYFEHEATYDRMCLVNDAVYIAKYATPEKCQQMYGYVPGDNKKAAEKNHWWTATGTQFQVPYVFKTLFSEEPIEFSDMCETKSVSQGEIYIDMNEGLPDVSIFEKELKQLETKYRKGELSDTTMEAERARLEPEIAKGHNYVFVGRVGSFCPIKQGCGGGELYRCKDGKYYAVAGTSGYRWLEAEVVQQLHKEDCIDESYYRQLCDEAVATINRYGSFDAFVDELPYQYLPFMDIPEDSPEEIPFK